MPNTQGVPSTRGELLACSAALQSEEVGAKARLAGMHACMRSGVRDTAFNMSVSKKPVQLLSCPSLVATPNGVVVVSEPMALLLPLSTSNERLLPRLQQLASLSELPHDCTPLLLSATGCDCSTQWGCSTPLC